MINLHADVYTSPIGDIEYIVDQEKLVFLDFADNSERIQKLMDRRYQRWEVTKKANAAGIADRLSRYFTSDWTAFDGIKMETGGTEFQRTVWRGLLQIKKGDSISYDQLASNIGNANAIRAAASANANNPIAIIIPCHRVIGKNGAMRGYAGGSERKVWLLQHEGALIQEACPT